MALERRQLDAKAMQEEFDMPVTRRRGTKPCRSFERLADIAERHRLELGILSCLHAGRLVVYVRDGADGQTGAWSQGIEHLDEAAALVILMLAKAGIR